MNESPELVPAPDPEQQPATVEVPAPTTESGSLAQTAADIEEIDVDSPGVAIVVSEPEDLESLAPTTAELDRRRISSEERVISADEEPRAVVDYIENASLRGIRVIIAGAGPGARLPAAITIHTRLPVIGVPLSSRGAQAEGVGTLLAERSDEFDEPVAWVGLDDAVGAAVLAARILGT